MNQWIIWGCSIGYLLLLFGIASWVERKSRSGKSLIHNPYIYALSLAVYCTAWTYFGSIGRVTSTGVEFIFIYLGPTLAAPLLFIMLRKIIRIAKHQNITSIADFISTRFGKNISLGAIVALLSIIGVIPYIAIQLKAISDSIKTISGEASIHKETLIDPTTFFIVVAISTFIILFGTRKVDASEKHEGMMVAIAFESIVKLFSFLVIGLFVVFVLFNGWEDLMTKAKALSNYHSMTTIQGDHTFFHLFLLMMLSLCAFLFLPRQFQVSVVENVREDHIKKAVWLFPLYLLLINIFVLPIAFAGNIYLKDKGVNADTFILALPMLMKNDWLTMLVYIGGFSAASSMIIVETIALTTMLSNNIVAPVFFSLSSFKEKSNYGIQSWLKITRRIGIVLIMILAFLFEQFIAEKFSLVSIGLISFAAVAQFAPAMIGGVYWKRATKAGALMSLLIGFCIWFYTLIIPSLINAGFIDNTILTTGPFGLSFLIPNHLFGLNEFDFITHGFFWSILFNILTFFGVSIMTDRVPQEIYQAALFVDVYKLNMNTEQPSLILEQVANMNDLRSLMFNFLGKERGQSILNAYEKKYKVQLSELQQAPPHLISVVEKMLSGSLGSAAAKLVLNNIIQQKELEIHEVLRVIKESEDMKVSNALLVKESTELNALSKELKLVNEQLKRVDQMKDEFLYTVTHEIRTPLTSIRALSEILQDNPDISNAEKNTYLDAVVKETERLSHLITQVLNLERYESGRQSLKLSMVDMNEMVAEIISSVDSLKREKSLMIHDAVPSLPILKLDKDLMHQVIYNLLTNAIKFAQSEITISAIIQKQHILFSIQDDGIGIEKEWQELVFDKFFQAQNQTLKKPEGSGLGLAISKRIVEMHRGKIWVESQFGQGAKFCFEIPLKK